MSPKLSVIVPVYNVEKYIGLCLESLSGQTFKDIEIICVNDASPDGSGDIVRRYMQKDHRITLLNHSKNRGVSVARNMGLKVAQAEFVTFVDSDDFLDLDAYEKALQCMTDDIDLLCFGVQIHGKRDEQRKKDDEAYYSIKYQGKVAITDEVVLSTDASVWNKIFRKSIIDQYAVSFPEGLRYEDAYFVYAYSLWVKNIYFMPNKFYHYLRRDDSIMGRTFQDGFGYSIDHTKIGIALYHYIRGKENYVLRQYWPLYFNFLLFSIKFSLVFSKSKPHQEEIYNLAVGFLNREHLWEKIPDELCRSYELLRNRMLLGGIRYRCAKLIRIKEKLTKATYSICGLPLLKITYSDIGKKIYLFHFIPVFVKKNYEHLV